MTNNKVKYPQFITIDSEIKSNYLDPLINDPLSMYYKREAGEAYLMAASMGYRNGVRRPTASKREGLRLFETMNDDYKVLFRVIAAADNEYNFDTLLDGAQTTKVVEEYANAGAPLLYAEAVQISDSAHLQNEIWDLLKKASLPKST